MHRILLNALLISCLLISSANCFFQVPTTQPSSGHSSKCPENETEISPVFSCATPTNAANCSEWTFGARPAIYPFRVTFVNKTNNNCLTYTTSSAHSFFTKSSVKNCSGIYHAYVNSSQEQRLQEIYYDEPIYCRRFLDVLPEHHQYMNLELDGSPHADENTSVDTNVSQGDISFDLDSLLVEPIFKTTKFIEFVLVVDSALYSKYFNSKDDELKRFVELQATAMNDVYRKAGINVVLKGLEVWKEEDKFSKAHNLSQMLDLFEQYAYDELYAKYKYDAAHLLTGIQYPNSHSEARFAKACSPSSLTVLRYVDSLETRQHFSTMSFAFSHELGHNLGLPHVNSSDCICPNGCLMAPYQIGFDWSNCSIASMGALYENRTLDCLDNVPEAAVLQLCGNGVLEVDEQCDCPVLDKDCRKCCDLQTCKLKRGADCTTGACCDNCHRITTTNVVCRPNVTECDLVEKCDGKIAFCPEDKFADGKSCLSHDSGNLNAPHVDGFCLHGSCRARGLQCRQIFGQGASDCPTHYPENVQGRFPGHCGGTKNKPIACARKDVNCGKLHCQWDESQAVVKPPNFHETSTQIKGQSKVCYGIDATLNETFAEDGLVADGSKCGELMWCLKNKCVHNPFAVDAQRSLPATANSGYWVLSFVVILIVIGFMALGYQINKQGNLREELELNSETPS